MQPTHSVNLNLRFVKKLKRLHHRFPVTALVKLYNERMSSDLTITGWCRSVLWYDKSNGNYSTVTRFYGIHHALGGLFSG